MNVNDELSATVSLRFDLEDPNLVTPTQHDFYIDLPPIKVKPPCPKLLWSTEQSGYTHFAAAEQTSTYPLLPDGVTRDGDPIADKFFFTMVQNRCIMAIADGCNWGARSMNAARSAIAAFREYFVEPRGDKRPRHEKINDLRDAGHMLLRSFESSHKKILSSTREDIWEAGTTTLIGCLLLELDVDDNKGIFGFLCASVGDCKAFVYHRKADKVIDVTAGNRLHVKDKRDPGGRLGPYCTGGTPDLRNLSLYFVRCHPGDLIISMSDGVHDNLDPEQLGLNPSDLDIQIPKRSIKDVKEWSSLDRQEAEDVKNIHRESFILNLIKRGKDSPKELNDELINHCDVTTKSSRDFMEQNPHTPQPMDYLKYPGKMDHTTCITFCVLPPTKDEE
eukprot:TRINITY_DN1630_c0_g1_i2.p1 TRINITY_DN1630_c0_g1~~TRINITY_DN1630_c0_g1_i2.p1  ORF type:complete len:390 (-),score=69.41 TRINITY_DN1630_c0_g1_i2:82-1251(-)